MCKSNNQLLFKLILFVIFNFFMMNE